MMRNHKTNVHVAASSALTYVKPRQWF
jgi:hypothetical protein